MGKAKGNGPVLLAGGNPQIAKGHGEGPVRAWIAACPGWKQPVTQEIDRIVGAVVPGVARAVKWNSPLYGIEGEGWFLGMHCLTRYVKLAFFRGTELVPPPPVGSKQPLVRYLHVAESGLDDPARFADWVAQASRLPGVRM